VIYLGDYNISTSGELSYQIILSNRAPNGIQQGQGIDPLNLTAAQLYQYLTTASDHLPMVADYTIPVPDLPPVASFTPSPTNGAAPLSVSFTDTSTGSISSWSWTFGDGGTTNLATNRVFYTYNTPGVYSVTEIVSGAGGSSTDTVANFISVYDPFAWWQLGYFGSANNPNAAPGGDYPGTGTSNTNKFLAGFNPTNPAAYLHVISIANTNTADINVIYLGANGDSSWSPGIASRTNVLEFTSGAANGSYPTNNFASTGQTNILSGGNGTGIVTNMVDSGGATNTPSRYYRILVLVLLP
jgi:PKD repeat protein